MGTLYQLSYGPIFKDAILSHLKKLLFFGVENPRAFLVHACLRV
jgi:hypothetical protein